MSPELAVEIGRLEKMLIERITFDRSDGTIEIKMHATAIKSLAEAASENGGGE